MSDNHTTNNHDSFVTTLRDNIFILPSSSETVDRISYQPLLREIGDARVVLIGECTHGTSEFYKERQKLTKWLIEEKDFTVLAVEADWLEAQRCHSYVRGMDVEIKSAENALSDFKEFPSWMWRNEDVRNFLEWLRQHNDRVVLKEESNGSLDGIQHKLVGFYGLDIYSMHASLLEVKRFLEKHRPNLAQKIVQRYNEMADRGRGNLADENPDLRGLANSELLDHLIKLLEEAGQNLLARVHENDPSYAVDLHFFAEQNSRVMKHAKEYCQALLKGGQLAWNVREEHMFEAVMALIDHLQKTRPPSMEKPLKVVVWAHNVHVGDARGMEMGWKGALSLGQLFRERTELPTFSIGFSTYQGTLTSADEWGGEAKCFDLLPAQVGSYEEIFHCVNVPKFYLHLTEAPLKNPNLVQREIGTLYRPKEEHAAHYFHAALSDQFDAIIHFDSTNAVQPLT